MKITRKQALFISKENLDKRSKIQDFYQTPAEAVELFLDHPAIKDTILKSSTILEPCCGKLSIVKVLKKYGYRVKFYDLYQKGSYKLKDFFKEKKHYDCIITNPPFMLLSEFLDHALKISDSVYFLLPLNYLHGKSRYQLFYSKKYLQAVYIYTRYIFFSQEPQDRLAKKGQIAMAWFNFSKKRSKFAKTYFIDCEIEKIKTA
jgi:hypothetical protein